MRRARGRAVSEEPPEAEAEEVPAVSFGLLRLLALPLSLPLEALVGVAGAVRAEAEGQLDDAERVRIELAELQAAHERGELSAAQQEQAEEQLLVRLDELRRRRRPDRRAA